MTKKVLLTACMAVSFGLAQAQTVPTVTESLPAVTFSQTPTVASRSESLTDRFPLVSNVISFAKKHLAIRYRSGGTTPRGFDCSGFTRFCFDQFGISLPHSSAAQGTVGKAVAKDEAQPGDLILFKGHSAAGSRIGHVGLITEVTNDHIKFIHSAWSGGIRYDYLSADYYQRRFMGIRRVISLLADK